MKENVLEKNMKGKFVEKKSEINAKLRNEDLDIVRTNNYSEKKNRVEWHI